MMGFFQRIFMSALLLAGVAFTLTIWLYSYKVEQVMLINQPNQVTAQDMLEVLKPLESDSLLFVDLDEWAQRAESLTWVKSAELKTHWPNQVHIKLNEYEPAYRWNSEQLMDVSGYRWTPTMAQLAQYQNLTNILVEGTAWPVLEPTFERLYHVAQANFLTPKLVEYEQVIGWKMHLPQGLEIRMGKHDVVERFQRFTQVLKKLSEDDLKSAKIIDLRYSNGFTLQTNQK